ncbi:MAG: penicillin acylase family protein, partial [Deltaproteobacteria bacterium]|nr:penicillin acylase family protein [Deltaproteobacteria bacterium]
MTESQTSRATWTRDEHGIPQITADDITGLYWGMGYCHAMDRGLQMLIMRILGQGRAAELLEGSDEMVDVDRFFRRMNWSGGVTEEAENLSTEARVACEAYCDGVNARFSESVPWELKLARVKPDAWTIGDSLLLARMSGFLTLAQSQGEVERLFVEMVQAGIGDAHLEALFPGCTDGLDRAMLDEVELGERMVPEAVKWGIGVPRLMASNNWCVSGS